MAPAQTKNKKQQKKRNKPPFPPVNRAMRAAIAGVLAATGRPERPTASAVGDPTQTTESMPAKTKKLPVGPCLRFERDYPHLTLPTTRVNVSSGTRDTATWGRYCTILNQLAHAQDGQAFYQSWLSMSKKRWTVPEIAKVYQECNQDPEATIQRLLRSSLQVATWSKALEEFKKERHRVGVSDVEKEIERLAVFRRWLTTEGLGEQLTELVSTKTIRGFLGHISTVGASERQPKAASARTQNRYRDAIMQLCLVIESTWPGICKVTTLRGDVKQAKMRLMATRELRWTRCGEQRYYLSTYVTDVPPGRGQKPVHRPDIGLAFRTLYQTAMDAGDLVSKLTEVMLVQHPDTGGWFVVPGMRSKIERKAQFDLKGQRRIPISDELAQELFAHAEEHVTRIAGHGGRLFGWLDPTKLSRQHEHLVNAIGWGPATHPPETRITMKDLRHCGALRWERALRTDSDIAKRMGHDDPRTIRMYLRGVPPTEAERISDEHAAAQVAPAPWLRKKGHPSVRPTDGEMEVLLVEVREAATVAQASARRPFAWSREAQGAVLTPDSSEAAAN